MRREIIFGLVLMLLLSSLTIISENASAGIKKEDMTWSTGDKWEYRYTTIAIATNMTTILKMTVKITGESVVEIDGANYNVFVEELTGEVETINIPISATLNLSLVEGSTIDGTLYVAKENDETTKTVQNVKYQLREGITGTLLNQTSIVVTFSVLTSGGKPDVIDVGTNWNSTIESETTTTITVSGSFYDTLHGEPGYTNTTTTTGSSTETINYECTSKKTITTAAGTFETYEIKQSKGQGYTLQYLSSTVKGDVKDVAYDDDGNIVSLMELISYDMPSSTAKKTPGFELAIVAIAIAFSVLLRRKR